MAPVNDYTKGYLNSLMDVQARIYGHYFFDELISEEMIEDINRQYVTRCPDTTFKLQKEALKFAMASEVTRKDRIILLSLCGKRWDTKLYSYNDNAVLENVKKYQPVDYVTQMPKIFVCSQINLNPTLRCVQSRISLRAFDIMGAGGFLLFNYQEEFMDFYGNEQIW